LFVVRFRFGGYSTSFFFGCSGDSSLLGCLGHLRLTTFTLLDGLDDTDGNRLPHVTHGKATEWSVLGEGLHAHRLLGDHLHNGGISRLDVRGVVFQLLTGTTIDLLEQVAELAGDVGRVAIDDWGVASIDLTRMVQDDDLENQKKTCVNIMW